MSVLTTITPYWGRKDVLRHFVSRLAQAATPGVTHIIFFVGEHLPEWWNEISPFPGLAIMRPEAPSKSIGHYHNLGAQLAQSEWIMKLDLDAMPHVDYFKKLLPILATAGSKQWFNGGMFYLNGHYSDMVLSRRDKPIQAADVEYILKNPRSYTNGSYYLPQASNFICRRETYLKLGGCDERFVGWGWEDYQQMFMLEAHEQGRFPLPFRPNLSNVTQRCRDAIGRPKARQLLTKDAALCLLHKHHAAAVTDIAYKLNANKNREVLLDYISKRW